MENLVEETLLAVQTTKARKQRELEEKSWINFPGRLALKREIEELTELERMLIRQGNIIRQ